MAPSKNKAPDAGEEIYDNLDAATIKEASDWLTSLDLADFSVDMADFAKIIAFEGFDPKKFLGYLWMRCKSSPTENSLQHFRSDMAKVCTVVATRGTKMDKIAQKSKANGKTEIMKLIAKYKIVSVKPVGGHVVTAARIAAVFAPYVVLLTDELVEIPKITNAMLKCDLPNGMRCPSFGSVIPMDMGDITLLLKKAFLWQQVCFSNMIKVAARADDLIKYLDIQTGQTLFDDAFRTNLLIRLEILEARPVAPQAQAVGAAIGALQYNLHRDNSGAITQAAEFWDRDFPGYL